MGPSVSLHQWRLAKVAFGQVVFAGPVDASGDMIQGITEVLTIH
jgi:hypothetical protein